MLACKLTLTVGLLAVIFYGPAVSMITMFQKLLKTNAEAEKCLKDAQARGNTQLFGGYSGPTESYCVCMHSGGNNKDMCRLQAEMIYWAYMTSFYAAKRKSDDVTKGSELNIMSGPDTESISLPCSKVEWIKEANKLIFSSCRTGTYKGELECRRQAYAGEKETDKWKPTHTVVYHGEISSARVSATVDFGPEQKPENAQATNVACTATATASGHRFLFSSGIDKTKDPDQKSEYARASALSKVKGLLNKLNKESGKTEGDFICDILKRAITAAVKHLAADGINLVQTESLEYSNEDMQQDGYIVKWQAGPS